jgi:hypothetical protein
MPRVRFEPTIPVFERAKTLHAVDRAATVIGAKYKIWYINYLISIVFVGRKDSVILKRKTSLPNAKI